MAGWLRLVRALGQTLLEVLRAEVAALGADLSGNAGRLVKALGLLVGVLFAAFWLLGLVLFLAVELLALVLPRWGAVAIVAGVLLLVGLVLGLLARRRLRALESPARTVQRRWSDHLAWWQERVLTEGEELSARSPAAAPEGAEEEE